MLAAAAAAEDQSRDKQGYKDKLSSKLLLSVWYGCLTVSYDKQGSDDGYGYGYGLTVTVGYGCRSVRSVWSRTNGRRTAFGQASQAHDGTVTDKKDKSG